MQNFNIIESQTSQMKQPPDSNTLPESDTPPASDFEVIYYEVTRITRIVSATNVNDAIEKSEAVDGWQDCDEVTLGTSGVEEVWQGSKRVYKSPAISWSKRIN